MKMYMASGEYSEEGAVLVFAENGRQAKAVAWRESGVLKDMVGDEYTGVKVHLIKNSPWLEKEADQAKLAAGVAHVVDEPICCEVCNCWGKPMKSEKLCDDCGSDREASA